MDIKSRSLVKSLVYRLICITIMPLVIFLVGTFLGKDLSTIAILSTIIFQGIMIGVYYAHERIWEKIKWGKNGCA